MDDVPERLQLHLLVQRVVQLAGLLQRLLRKHLRRGVLAPASAASFRGLTHMLHTVLRNLYMSKASLMVQLWACPVVKCVQQHSMPHWVVYRGATSAARLSRPKALRHVRTIHVQLREEDKPRPNALHGCVLLQQWLGSESGYRRGLGPNVCISARSQSPT